VYRHDIETSTNAIVNHTTNDLRQLSTLTTQMPDNRVSQYVACFIWQISLLHCFVMNYVWHEGSRVVIMILCQTVDIDGYCREYIDTISICTSALKLQLHVCRWIIKTSQTVGEGKLGRWPHSIGKAPQFSPVSVVCRLYRPKMEGWSFSGTVQQHAIDGVPVYVLQCGIHLNKEQYLN